MAATCHHNCPNAPRQLHTPDPITATYMQGLLPHLSASTPQVTFPKMKPSRMDDDVRPSCQP